MGIALSKRFQAEASSYSITALRSYYDKLFAVCNPPCSVLPPLIYAKDPTFFDELKEGLVSANTDFISIRYCSYTQMLKTLADVIAPELLDDFFAFSLGQTQIVLRQIRDKDMKITPLHSADNRITHNSLLTTAIAIRLPAESPLPRQLMDFLQKNNRLLSMASLLKNHPLLINAIDWEEITKLAEEGKPLPRAHTADRGRVVSARRLIKIRESLVAVK